MVDHAGQVRRVAFEVPARATVGEDPRCVLPHDDHRSVVQKAGPVQATEGGVGRLVVLLKQVVGLERVEQSGERGPEGGGEAQPGVALEGAQPEGVTHGRVREEQRARSLDARREELEGKLRRPRAVGPVHRAADQVGGVVQLPLLADGGGDRDDHAL